MKVPQGIAAVAAAAMLLIGPTSLAAALDLGPVQVDVSPALSAPGARVSVGVSDPSLGVEVGATAGTSVQVGGSEVAATVGASATVTSPVASASISVPPTTVGVSTGPGGEAPGGSPGDAGAGGSTPAAGHPGSSAGPVARRPPAPARARHATHPAAHRGDGAALAQAAAPGAVPVPVRRDGLLSSAGRAVAAAATAAARSVWFPIALLIAFGLYLIVQRRLDQGPKLLATGHGSPDDEVIEF